MLTNIRSVYNTGAIWRTADAAGIQQIITVGITPRPLQTADPRLPHIADRATQALAKTALGAEKNLPFLHFESLREALSHLRSDGYSICALEQHQSATNLFQYQPSFPLALVLGPELDGLTADELRLSDRIIQIPQYGQKESLNVSVAAGIATYFLRYYFDRNLASN